MKSTYQERDDHFHTLDNHRAAEGSLPKRDLSGFYGREWEKKCWQLHCSCGYRWEAMHVPEDRVFCPRCGYCHEL